MPRLNPYLLVLLALALPVPLGAQLRSSTATFVVTKAGREMGKERVTIESQGPGPMLRVRLVAQPLAGPALDATVRRSPDGGMDDLQLDVREDGKTAVVRAGHRGNRYVVTTSGAAGQRTREVPASDHVVLLDEGLHSLVLLAAERATAAGQPLAGLYVRSGRRVTFTASRRDMGSRGSAVDIKGDLEAYLLLDADGRLERLELPREGVLLSPLPD